MAMLSVTITEVPASSRKAEDIAHVQITNKADHPNRPDFGNYKWRIQEPGGSVVEGELDDFNREDGALDLLWRVLSMWRTGHRNKDINATISIYEEAE